MTLFQKPKAVLWPRSQTVDLYLDKLENNVFSLDINLWHSCSDVEIQSLSLLLQQNKVDTCTVLIPDDVVFTKSFIYDSEISTIEKSEVISLAESFINFKINPDYIDYKLIPSLGKTIIQAHIFDPLKIEALKTNLESIHLKSFNFESVSQAISNVISLHFDQEYFLIYPLGPNDYTILLSNKDSVFLTANLKGASLDVQKIVNYSNLYFSNPTTKFYIPSDRDLEINATSPLDKTAFNQAQMAQDFKKSPNIPLPVLGLMISSTAVPAIISTSHTSSPIPKMENKKNILPFIAVFIVTAAIASGIIWYVLNKNNNPQVDNVVSTSDVTPTDTVEVSPTETPTPSVATVSKTLKLQVLNATDINGQATVLKEKLTSLGFTSIAVGNSVNKLTENQIKIKPSLSSSAAYFETQLAGFFDAVPTTDLSENSTYDVVFYIGTDLGSGSTATTTATPTKKATALTPTKTATPTPTKATATATPIATPTP